HDEDDEVCDLELLFCAAIENSDIMSRYIAAAKEKRNTAKSRFAQEMDNLLNKEN
ncbi:MAG: hypothetical protein HUK15_06000, partial [Bacteroidales bacterium]|nr:hypothetical protein [Bacteroidales bacterium]